MANKDSIYEIIVNNLMYSVAIPDVINNPVVIEVVRNYFAQCLAYTVTHVNMDMPTDAVPRVELSLVLPNYYTVDTPSFQKHIEEIGSIEKVEKVVKKEKVEKVVKKEKAEKVLHRFSGIDLDG